MEKNYQATQQKIPSYSAKSKILGKKLRHHVLDRDVYANLIRSYSIFICCCPGGKKFCVGECFCVFLIVVPEFIISDRFCSVASTDLVDAGADLGFSTAWGLKHQQAQIH